MMYTTWKSAHKEHSLRLEKQPSPRRNNKLMVFKACTNSYKSIDVEKDSNHHVIPSHADWLE